MIVTAIMHYHEYMEGYYKSLDWTTGLDYWTGLLPDSDIFVSTHSKVIFVMSLKTKGLQGAFCPL